MMLGIALMLGYCVVGIETLVTDAQNRFSRYTSCFLSTNNNSVIWKMILF